MNPMRTTGVGLSGAVREPIYEPITSLQRQEPGRLYNYTIQYWGRKPWNVIRHYIQHFAPDSDSLVADPYAGGGVTLGESLRTRHRTIGLDIQPLSELINRSLIARTGPLAVSKAGERVKLAVRPLLARVEGGEGLREAKNFLSSQSLSFLEQSPPPSLTRPDARTFLETFDPRHLAGLLATRSAIEREEDQELRVVLWLAFANMLRYANRGYEAKHGKGNRLQKWSGDHVIFKYKRLGGSSRFTYIPFDQILDHCLDRVYKLKTITDREFGDYINAGEKASFFRDDATRLSHYVSEVLSEREIDYVIMDPPYKDLVGYSALTSYWNIWLPREFALRATPLEAALENGEESFTARLAASIADAASVLRTGGWLTLFYLDIWDFGLWHRILEEAADARLEHVNSTWNPQQIRSATQIQNPLSGISGAVIANFRRIRSRVRLSGSDDKPVQPLTTPLVYLGHQLQRIVVENLGATTSEVLSHISDEIYTRFALEYFAEEETQSVRELLHDLGATELKALQPARAAAPPLWILREDARPDPQLDLYDRIRYRLFVELARRGEASSATLLQSIYTDEEEIRPEQLHHFQIDGLLATFAEPISGTVQKRGGWRIDWKSRFEDAQLRLLLSTTSAHRLQETIERRGSVAVEPLHINVGGFNKLANAGPGGPAGQAWQTISRAVHLLATTVRDSLGSIIDSVWAVREFAEGKWDPEEPKYDDLPVLVILRDHLVDPIDIEDSLLEGLFAKLYIETHLNFVPYFRTADDPDIVVLFGPEEQRVLLVDALAPSATERASA